MTKQPTNLASGLERVMDGREQCIVLIHKGRERGDGSGEARSLSSAQQIRHGVAVGMAWICAEQELGTATGVSAQQTICENVLYHTRRGFGVDCCPVWRRRPLCVTSWLCIVCVRLCLPVFPWSCQTGMCYWPPPFCSRTHG
jgi:hypothetical protein